MPENGPDAQYFQEDWCSREANINLVLILCMDINNNNNQGSSRVKFSGRYNIEIDSTHYRRYRDRYFFNTW